MKQTPIHEIHNAELLNLIPINAKKIIEITQAATPMIIMGLSLTVLFAI
jgi:hypothetical protein